MAFTDEEAAFLRSHGIARLATVGRSGQPDVVPVAVEFDGDHFWVGGSGASVLRTHKVSNVRAGRRKVALVVDDLPSFEPFVARGIRVYGVADGPVERVGMVGPGQFLRITPTISWSWNMAGEPVGAEWYETRRAVHDGPRAERTTWSDCMDLLRRQSAWHVVETYSRHQVGVVAATCRVQRPE